MSDTFNQKLSDSNKPYWIWGPLAFSSFYFLPLIFSFERFNIIEVLLIFVIYGLFIFLYAKSVHACGEKAALPVFLIVSLSIVGTAITPGTQSLFGFASFFCGFNFPVKKGIQGLIGIILAIFLSAFTFGFVDVYFIAPAFVVSIGLFFFGHAERRDRIHNQAQEKSQEQIEQLAAIAERERIARDLHDLLGHSLTSIALKADLADKFFQAEQLELAGAEISQVAQLSRNTLSEIRAAVSGLKQKELVSQVNKLTAELQAQDFDVVTDIQVSELSANLESHLILILTEACTNIQKHSNAKQVKISILESNDNITVTISDDGSVKKYQSGNGLTGIDERCQQLGGQLDISLEDGFTLAVKIEKETHD